MKGDGLKALDLDTQSVQLRTELKEWEKQFAAASGGRKADRDDIKRHPTIAAKYKEYTKLRDVLAGRTRAEHQQQSPSAGRSKERPRPRRVSTSRAEGQDGGVPLHSHSEATPSKLPHPTAVDPYDSPSQARRLQRPHSFRTSIGPTPQKDGKILGLFDLLSDDDDDDGQGHAAASTPSKNRVLAPLPSVNLQRGPMKTGSIRDHESPISRLGRSPVSAGKRFLLDSFSTPPSKRIRIDGTAVRTPKSSVSKLQFSTPAFLRRTTYNTRPSTGDGRQGESPVAVPMPRPPVVRGLSSILAGLRKMEEERLDDELEAMREMEMDVFESGPPPPSSSHQPLPPPPPKDARADSRPQTSSSSSRVLVEDNQLNIAQQSADRFDDLQEPGSPSSSTQDRSQPPPIAAPALGRDGKPLRVWKKKGQKRTTRRVNMRPVRSVPVASGAPRHDPSSALDQDDDDDDSLHSAANPPPLDALATTANNPDAPAQRYLAARALAAEEERAAAAQDKQQKKKKKTHAVEAHANFKRLKLRGRGAKPSGKGAGGGRFGRGRR